MTQVKNIEEIQYNLIDHYRVGHKVKVCTVDPRQPSLWRDGIVIKVVYVSHKGGDWSYPIVQTIRTYYRTEPIEEYYDKINTEGFINPKTIKRIKRAFNIYVYKPCNIFICDDTTKNKLNVNIVLEDSNKIYWKSAIDSSQVGSIDKYTIENINYLD